MSIYTNDNLNYTNGGEYYLSTDSFNNYSAIQDNYNDNYTSNSSYNIDSGNSSESNNSRSETFGNVTITITPVA